ncbi:hypothetical protein KUTeg_022295 [Tegillarca granosa]|uniref:Uncharacterized protein n=1 Tax=Tegillarca granosa TaxID=220873 RepID=A0ABQ9EAD6_TEGGR|nr:hypothetical protein KUTeg_022295 [Tegillarca granosa]
MYKESFLHPKRLMTHVLKKLTELDKKFYEVEVFKKKNISIFHIKLCEIAYFRIYNDFQDKYIGRNNFELIETDTDSIYFALASRILQKLVKQGIKRRMTNI